MPYTTCAPGPHIPRPAPTLLARFYFCDGCGRTEAAGCAPGCPDAAYRGRVEARALGCIGAGPVAFLWSERGPRGVLTFCASASPRCVRHAA